jgi:hypothetical protein
MFDQPDLHQRVRPLCELDRVTDKADVRRLRKHTSRFVPVFTISRDPAPAAVEPN